MTPEQARKQMSTTPEIQCPGCKSTDLDQFVKSPQRVEDDRLHVLTVCYDCGKIFELEYSASEYCGDCGHSIAIRDADYEWSNFHQAWGSTAHCTCCGFEQVVYFDHVGWHKIKGSES